MTFRIPTPSKPLVTHIQFYTLYRKIDGHYERMSNNSYTLKLAARMFGEKLLSDPFVYSIRPVRLDIPKAQGITKFGGKSLTT